MAIEDELRGVVASHRAEWGARADQLMVNDRLYPGELLAWADEAARLRAAIERHIEQAARDDYNATHLGDLAAPPWAGLTDAGRALYRRAVSDDFWREG